MSAKLIEPLGSDCAPPTSAEDSLGEVEGGVPSDCCRVSSDCCGVSSGYRCLVLCGRDIKSVMLLRLRGKQTSQTCLYLILGVCLFLLLSMRNIDPHCHGVKGSGLAAKDVTDPPTPENQSETKYVINTDSSTTFEKTFPYGTKRNDSTPVIFITSLTPVQPDQDEWFIQGEYEFQNCPNLESYMRCHYITKPTAINFSTAVLFHSRFLDEIDIPKTRKPGQKWIFFESEPPPETWKRADLTRHRDIFNATSTYTVDSDIPLWYHKSVCVPNLGYEPPTHNLAATKSKLVAWFVSSCVTHSKREDYVTELQKYIPVDIFGKCGESKCHKEGVDGEACIRDTINSTYKFYLSFENSLCFEYSTEKLSRIFSLNTIPIVLGLVNYANILPPGTYIDVRDFSSPKALADHLLEIDRNDDLFNSYVIKKNSFWCHLPVSISYACQVCRYLHEHRYERKTVHDVSQFWSMHHRCMAPETFYKGVADSIAFQSSHSSK